MNNLTAIVILCICTLSFLVSCGSDDPVTNNNQNPPVEPVIDTISLLTKDSIFFNQSIPLDSGIISILTTSQVDTIRLNFNYHLFAVTSLAVFKVDADTLFRYEKRPLSLPFVPFDTSISLRLPINKINFISVLSIYPTSGFFNGNEYASLRNIKLWYIRRS